MSSNNVRYLHTQQPSEADRISPEPTPLQQEVFARARELRELERERALARPEQWRTRWIVSGVLAVVAFIVMFTAIDVVLRKMQQLLEGMSLQQPPPAATEPAPQSTDASQPYFIELQPQVDTEAISPSPPAAETPAP